MKPLAAYFTMARLRFQFRSNWWEIDFLTLGGSMGVSVRLNCSDIAEGKELAVADVLQFKRRILTSQ